MSARSTAQRRRKRCAVGGTDVYATLQHLERRGLLKRTASAINRRYYVLDLTDAGTTILSRMRPAIAEGEKKLAAKIGKRAYEALQRALSIFLHEC